MSFLTVRDCRYHSDVALFLSSQNDKTSLSKLLQAGRLRLLYETQEVQVVRTRRKVNYPDPRGDCESSLAKMGAMQVTRWPGARGPGSSRPLYINSQCRPR